MGATHPQYSNASYGTIVYHTYLAMVSERQYRVKISLLHMYQVLSCGFWPNVNKLIIWILTFRYSRMYSGNIGIPRLGRGLQGERGREWVTDGQIKVKLSGAGEFYCTFH